MQLAPLLSLLGVCGCATVLPPHVQSAAPVPVSSATTAKVVFLRPPNSCEIGGYYTVVTEGGRLLGNAYSQMRLEAELPPGPVTFVAWNAEVQPSSGRWEPKDVAIAVAKLEPGRTYFVRFAFGEWNVRGPVGPVRWSLPNTLYVRSICPTVEPALLAVRPVTAEWSRLRDWLDDQTPVRALPPARPVDPGQYAEKLQLARTRFELMTPEARELATVRPEDGVRISAR